MAGLQGNGDTTYNLSDDAVKAYLMDAYNSLNTMNGNSDQIDWSTTDKAIWDDVIAALQKDGIYGQLSPTYLNNLIAQIMQKGQAETTAAETETPKADSKKKKKNGWGEFWDFLWAWPGQ